MEQRSMERYNLLMPSLIEEWLLTGTRPELESRDELFEDFETDDE
jgi:hypothetical protein